MIIVRFKDGSEKKFKLKNVDREKSLKEMWQWCSIHVPEKKFKIKTTEGEQFVVRISEIDNIVWKL